MSTEYGVFYGNNLYNYPVKKDPIIEHILYRNDVICISAKAGVGKSLLCMNWICNLTSGKPFLDLYTVFAPCNVLYIQTEGDRSETIERMGNFKRGLECDDSKWVHINQAGIVLNEAGEFGELFKMAREPGMKYDVIIIDPLYATVRGDLSKNSVATDWQRNVRLLKDYFGATLIVTHHEHKEIRNKSGAIIERSADDLLGSFAWGAFFNHNFKLKRLKGDDFSLISGKQRSGKIVDKITMRLEHPTPLYFELGACDIELTEQKAKTLFQEQPKLTAKKLATLLDTSKSTVYRVIKRLVDEGKIRKTVENSVSYYEWV